MNKFSAYITLTLVSLVGLLSSCSDDDIRASISLSQTSVYFSELGEQATVSYTGTNIADIKIESSDIPTGWQIYVSRGNQTVTVIGPTSQEDFDDSKSSSIVSIVATSVDDLSSYEYITVGTTSKKEDLSSRQANSFIASKPNTMYSFKATAAGEDQQTIVPERVAILWQTFPTPLTSARLNGEMVEFHTSNDEKDADEDGASDDIVEGNAVIAAYNSSNEIIWSWHIWVSDFSAEESAITLNGETLMSRNLGANDNANGSEQEILESYGLYYQWGRKDPFVTPSTYNASYGTDASIYSGSGISTSTTYKKSTSSIGSQNYATSHPLTFILGVEASSYDWLYSDSSSELWSETKSINDPCPKGWRVASPEVFENLSLPALSQDEHEAIANKYGWQLSDGAGNKDLFMGVGRRGYITGKIQNVNLNEERPAPWAGYYWTTAAEETKSAALYFAYDKTESSDNTISTQNHYRANGMQVRCQRIK